MNLTRARKIVDVAKELQTDELKMKIYRQIEKFVHKNQKHYYPHFKGEIHDLILDLFTKFIAPKKHRNGEVFSELDRVDPSEVGGSEWTGDDDKAIATYVQRFVIARLIDLERMDKREVNASENYDDNNPGLTLDRAASGNVKRSSGDDGMLGGAYIENINYQFYDLMDNPQAIKNARKNLVDNPEQVNRIRFLAKHYDDKLDPKVKAFINKLLGEEEDPEVDVVSISEARKDVENLLGESVKISNYMLQRKPAVKMAFADKDAMDAASDKKDKVISLMDMDGYEFYKAHGANWYFFKKEQVEDSFKGSILNDSVKDDEYAVDSESVEYWFNRYASKQSNPNFKDVTVEPNASGWSLSYNGEVQSTVRLDENNWETVDSDGIAHYAKSIGSAMRQAIRLIHYVVPVNKDSFNKLKLKDAAISKNLQDKLSAFAKEYHLKGPRYAKPLSTGAMTLYGMFKTSEEANSVGAKLNRLFPRQKIRVREISQVTSEDAQGNKFTRFSFENVPAKVTDDARSVERFNSLMSRVGDKPKHYTNQIEKSQGYKKVERARTFYKLAKENGLDATAQAIKNQFPDIYSPEEIAAEKEAQEQAKREEKRKAQEQQKADIEAKKQAALEGGPTFCGVSYIPGSYTSAVDQIFVRFAKKHPKGFVVTCEPGDVSVGARYERRDGRVYTLAYKYKVSNADNTASFDVACLSNEGYDPDNKTGWETDANGKRWFVGKAFGWMLNGNKMSFSYIRSTITSQLNSKFS